MLGTFKMNVHVYILRNVQWKVLKFALLQFRVRVSVRITWQRHV